MDIATKKIVDEEMKKYYEPVPRESGKSVIFVSILYVSVVCGLFWIFG